MEAFVGLAGIVIFIVFVVVSLIGFGFSAVAIGATMLSWIGSQGPLKQKRRDQWKAIAARRGLQCTGDRIHGEIDGVRCEVRATTAKRTKHPVAHTMAVAVVPAPMPLGLTVRAEALLAVVVDALGMPDIAVGKALDARLRVRGRHPDDVRALFEVPEAGAACLELTELDSLNRVEDGAVSVYRHGWVGDEAEALLDRAVGLATRLAAARLTGLVDVETRGFVIERPSEVTWAGRGEVRGFAVRIEGHWADARTTLTVPVDGLPPALRVEAGSAGEIRLGDPILDHMVCAFGAPREQLTALLVDEDVRGDLLAVLGPHPHSVVSGSGVTMVLERAVDPLLWDHIEDAVRLAESLAHKARGLGSSEPA